MNNIKFMEINSLRYKQLFLRFIKNNDTYKSWLLAVTTKGKMSLDELIDTSIKCQRQCMYSYTFHGKMVSTPWAINSYYKGFSVDSIYENLSPFDFQNCNADFIAFLANNY